MTHTVAILAPFNKLEYGYLVVYVFGYRMVSQSKHWIIRTKQGDTLTIPDAQMPMTDFSGDSDEDLFNASGYEIGETWALSETGVP